MEWHIEVAQAQLQEETREQDATAMHAHWPEYLLGHHVSRLLQVGLVQHRIHNCTLSVGKVKLERGALCHFSNLTVRCGQHLLDLFAVLWLLPRDLGCGPRRSMNPVGQDACCRKGQPFVSSVREFAR